MWLSADVLQRTYGLADLGRMRPVDAALEHISGERLGIGHATCRGSHIPSPAIPGRSRQGQHDRAALVDVNHQ